MIKVTFDAFHTPICGMRLIITVMIINTGQMCTVNYSDRPRMCDLNCPNWKKYDELQRLEKKYKITFVSYCN